MKKQMMIFSGVLLLFILITGGYFGYDYYKKNIEEKAILTLDVNPSIRLFTNYYDKVVKLEALNDDGEKILTDLDLVGEDVIEAAKIVTDKLIEQGYLSGDGANVLLTVQNKDIEKADELKLQVSDAIEVKMTENYIAGTVLAQSTTTRSNIPDSIKTLMSDYHISYSKAIFITKLVEQNSDLVISDLAESKINELSKIIADSNLDASDFLGNNGHGIYQSSTQLALKKVKDAAEKAKDEATKVANELNNKLKEANQSEESQIMNQSAYEVAEQARAKAEESLEAATKAYEETTKLENQDTSSENKVQNQTSNGDVSNSTEQSEGQSNASSDKGKN